MRYLLLCLACSLSFLPKNTAPQVDLLVYNAVVYTVNSNFSVAEAIAVKDGKIIEVGKSAALLKAFTAKETVDAKGKFIYPGFIDAHTHFYRYSLGLQTANLTGTDSWEEIIDRLKTFAVNNKEGWLTGRGWDQNDWQVKEFPSKEKLDALFPDRPVLLSRVDGHAAIANQRALDMGGVKAGETIAGGMIEVKNGRLTGILVDNAVHLVASKVPYPSMAAIKQALLNGQRNCLAVGLTTVDDCGLDYREALLMDSLQQTGNLKMRVYAMLSDAKNNVTIQPDE